MEIRLLPIASSITSWQVAYEMHSMIQRRRSDRLTQTTMMAAMDAVAATQTQFH